MYCANCGKEMLEGTMFCPFCGEKREEIDAPEYGVEMPPPVAPMTVHEVVSPTVEPRLFSDNGGNHQQTEAFEYEGVAYQPMAPMSYGEIVSPIVEPIPSRDDATKKPRRKTKYLVMAGVALIVIAAAILVPVFLHNAKQNKYNEGVTLLEKGDYKGAQEVFEALGAFDDSENMAAFAKKTMTYDDAKRLMKSGEYQKAISLFAEISSFKDSDKLAAEAKSIMSYNEGKAHFDKGLYAKAEESFVKAGDYKDAREMVKLCRDHKDYQKAISLIENGHYEEALKSLNNLDQEKFPDVEDLRHECRNMPLYLAAKTMFESGKKYDAYKEFTALGNFKDAADMAGNCIVAKPSTGELFRNSAYKGSGCSLLIKPPANDGSSTYFKIYDQDGTTLVSVIFINKGDSVKVKLPPGSYIFKSAFGFGNWFGENEMFGEEGVYQRLKSSGTSEIFKLNKNYDYTLTLRTGNTSGDPVATEKENKNTF